MSLVALTARDRRTLTIGAVVVASLLLVTHGVPAWRRWVTESGTAEAEQRAAAVHAEVLVRALPTLRDSLAARDARYLALAPTLLAGSGANAAGATLVSLVTGAAAEAGVTLGAVQLRVADVGSGADRRVVRPAFIRVRVEADVTGDIRGITRWLLALEQGPVHLGVRELTVTQADPVGAADRAESLHATASVEGLALSAPPTSAPRRVDR